MSDDRRRVLADEHRGAVVTKNLLVRATLLVDGFVAGTWSVERKKAAATLKIEAFVKLPKRLKGAIEAEGEALPSFVEEGATTRAVTISAP